MFHRRIEESKNCIRSLRSLIGEPLDRANRLPVVAAAVVREATARIEAQLADVVVARVRNGRPVGAVRTGTAERSPTDVAGAGEEDAVGDVVALPAHNVPFHAALRRRPHPVAVADEIGQFLIRRQPPAAAPLHLRRVMPRREDVRAVFLNDPTLALKRGRRFVVGGRVRRAEREVRRRSVTRDPGVALVPVAHGVAPPEVVAVVLRILRADVRRRPVRPTLPELNLTTYDGQSPFCVQRHDCTLCGGQIVHTCTITINDAAVCARRPACEHVASPREAVDGQVFRRAACHWQIGHRARAAVRIEANGIVDCRIGGPDWANRMPVAATADERAVAARTKAEFPRAGVAVRVRDGRPEIADRIGTVERSPAAVADAGEEDAVRSVVAPAADNVAVQCRRPRPVALASKVVKFLIRRHPPDAAPLHLRRVMLRREDVRAVFLNDPAFALERGRAFAVGRRVRLLEREVR